MNVSNSVSIPTLLSLFPRKLLYVAVIFVMFVLAGCGGASSTTPTQNVSISVSPTSASVQTGASATFTAMVTGSSNTSVTWQVNGVASGNSTLGMIDASGKYTAPALVPSPPAVTVTAVAAADTTKSANAAVTVKGVITGNVSVTVSPARVAVSQGQVQTFSSAVTGTTSTNVTWQVDSVAGGNANVGTVDATGVYTTSKTTTPGIHTIAAVSVADPTASASASVAVTELAGVFTYHNDLSRDGVNSQEYALNTTTVKAATFGKRFACAIDASAYAQPLWVPSISINNATHNIVIAGTQHDTLYAFDADASPCQTLWSKSLLATGETWVSNSDVNTDDIAPDIGIVGTPVIDPATKTLYVVSKSKQASNGAFHQRLHALSLSDGSEKFSGPKEIAFTSGSITFDPLRQNQRCGLALVNGVVYIAYASHGDTPTYYGWVVGYSASSLAQVSVFNDAPVGASDGKNGGIWMSGGAPAADSSGNLFLITGNGPFDGNSDFGDSFLKLATGNGLSLASFFTPSNQGVMQIQDQDLGSGGATVLIDQPSSPLPRLLVGGGKSGAIYVLNRDSLGGNNAADNGVVQEFMLLPGAQIFSTPAFWQNTLYVGQAAAPVSAVKFDTASGKFPLSTGQPVTAVTSSKSLNIYGFPGATPSVSSQGATNGIVWTIEMASGPAILHAYDATDLTSELWNSSAVAADAAGGAVKFTVPTVANGKVYVGTSSEISVYGLSPN